jgi:hypothetical protein
MHYSCRKHSSTSFYTSGVHLKDIISLHVALQDRLEYDLINFRKLVQLSIVFGTLTDLQVSVPPVQPNNDLLKLLTVSRIRQMNRTLHERLFSFPWT